MVAPECHCELEAGEKDARDERGSPVTSANAEIIERTLAIPDRIRHRPGDAEEEKADDAEDDEERDLFGGRNDVKGDTEGSEDQDV